MLASCAGDGMSDDGSWTLAQEADATEQPIEPPPPPPYLPRAPASPVPTAAVSGPIDVTVPLGDPSHDYPQLASGTDLGARGYIEQEFFVSGSASRYDAPALATGKAISGGHPYKSRLLVRRPSDPTKFNGVVVVEWLNVTAGYNLDALWQSSAEFFMRSGYAYVGVSAQRVGVHGDVTGLKAWSPKRYASLDVTAGGTIVDDALSYDVFAQAAKAVGTPEGVDPLGDLPKKRVLLASGVSQSEGRLVTYYNAIEPLHMLFDGYYLFLGVGGKLRTDQDVKVLKINTETDVLLLREGAARQDDSNVLRTWEIAGASHVSYPSTLVRGPLLERDGLPVASTTCAKPALSRVPSSVVLNAAYGHLVGWIERDEAPPVAPRITLTSVGEAGAPSIAARDARGVALGGIRLPEVAAPTATNTGENSGEGYCILYGSHEPFDAATLRALYPTHDAYVSAVLQATADNVIEGFLLPLDANAAIQAAIRSNIGR